MILRSKENEAEQQGSEKDAQIKAAGVILFNHARFGHDRIDEEGGRDVKGGIPRLRVRRCDADFLDPVRRHLDLVVVRRIRGRVPDHRRAFDGGDFARGALFDGDAGARAGVQVDGGAGGGHDEFDAMVAR